MMCQRDSQLQLLRNEDDMRHEEHGPEEEGSEDMVKQQNRESSSVQTYPFSDFCLRHVWERLLGL